MARAGFKPRRAEGQRAGTPKTRTEQPKPGFLLERLIMTPNHSNAKPEFRSCPSNTPLDEPPPPAPPARALGTDRPGSGQLPDPPERPSKPTCSRVSLGAEHSLLRAGTGRGAPPALPPNTAPPDPRRPRGSQTRPDSIFRNFWKLRDEAPRTAVAEDCGTFLQGTGLWPGPAVPESSNSLDSPGLLPGRCRDSAGLHSQSPPLPFTLASHTEEARFFMLQQWVS